MLRVMSEKGIIGFMKVLRMRERMECRDQMEMFTDTWRRIPCSIPGGKGHSYRLGGEIDKHSI